MECALVGAHGMPNRHVQTDGRDLILYLVVYLDCLINTWNVHSVCAMQVLTDKLELELTERQEQIEKLHSSTDANHREQMENMLAQLGEKQQQVDECQKKLGEAGLGEASHEAHAQQVEKHIIQNQCDMSELMKELAGKQHELDEVRCVLHAAQQEHLHQMEAVRKDDTQRATMYAAKMREFTEREEKWQASSVLQ